LIDAIDASISLRPQGAGSRNGRGNDFRVTCRLGKRIPTRGPGREGYIEGIGTGGHRIGTRLRGLDSREDVIMLHRWQMTWEVCGNHPHLDDIIRQPGYQTRHDGARSEMTHVWKCDDHDRFRICKFAYSGWCKKLALYDELNYQPATFQL
jgi:hypothetical protein